MRLSRPQTGCVSGSTTPPASSRPCRSGGQPPSGFSAWRAPEGAKRRRGQRRCGRCIPRTADAGPHPGHFVAADRPSRQGAGAPGAPSSPARTPSSTPRRFGGVCIRHEGESPHRREGLVCTPWPTRTGCADEHGLRLPGQREVRHLRRRSDAGLTPQAMRRERAAATGDAHPLRFVPGRHPGPPPAAGSPATGRPGGRWCSGGSGGSRLGSRCVPVASTSTTCPAPVVQIT